MQRQVRNLRDPLDDERPMRGQNPLAVATDLARRNRARRPVALVPFYHRGHRYTKPRCYRPAALATRHRRHNTLAKIIGKRSGHKMLASTPASILNHNSTKNGIPQRFRLAVNRSSPDPASEDREAELLASMTLEQCEAAGLIAE